MNDEANQTAQLLTGAEARVLACLMEKELTTPDNYPLTLNSLTMACNQKSSREPVMNLEQGQVGHTVNELAERGLVRVEYGERAHRVSHRMRSAYRLDRGQQAVLAVLMLRKPQTINDIRMRTERMVNFDGAEEILLVLDDLMQRDPPLAVCIPKGPGRREDRYYHLLCGEVVPEEAEHPLPALPDEVPENIVGRLEARVDELEKQLIRLLKAAGLEP